MESPKFRTIDPKILYFGTPRSTDQFAERGRKHQPCAYVFLLGFGLDPYAGAAGRNQDR